MAKVTRRDLKRRFLESLSAKRVTEAARMFDFDAPTHEKRVSRMVNAQGDIVNVLLYTLEIPAKELKKAAKALEIDVTGLDSVDDLVEHLRYVNAEYIDAIDSGLPISSVNTSPDAEGEEESGLFDELWAEGERLAKTALHLKARKTTRTTSSPVAAWNSKVSSQNAEGVWLRVDLRHHPDKKLQADGVLTVSFSRGEDGEATFSKGEKLTVKKGERALYGEQASDIPRHEILLAKAKKSIRDQIDEGDDDLLAYEEAWWDEVNPRDLLSDSPVYVQLGGWPVEWPDEGVEEQMKKQLVLRTYHDSEPWLEVFRVGRKYHTVLRIT